MTEEIQCATRLVEDELLPEVKTKARAKPSRRRGGKRKYGNRQRSYFAIVEGGPLMVTK